MSKTEVKLPTSEADRQKLKGWISEIVKCIKDKEDADLQIKAIRQEIKTCLNVPPKYVMKVAKAMHKQNFSEIQSDYETFEDTYVTVVDGGCDRSE